MSDEDINESAVDRYTSAHAGIGVLLAKLGTPWWGALLGSIAWEGVENYVKRRNAQLFPYSSEDSWQNATMDTLAVMLGYAVTTHAMADGLSLRSDAAIDAAIGSTVGGVIGSATFGMTSGRDTRTHRARLGYRIGASVGAGAGTLLGAHGPIAAAGAILGGVIIGPVGAGLGGYLTAGIFREDEYVPELADNLFG